MDDDPAGLSGCVMTPIAEHQADAIGHGAERPAALDDAVAPCFAL